MSSSVQNLDRFKIPLEDILEATNHFSKKNFVRQGGFGKIYKGQLKRSGKLINVVARRLDTKHGQGTKQFWTEILMLSKLKDANLVSLVGFCDEKNEKIVINKYEAKGSLDNYLSDPSLTWLQRLQICVGVSHALYYIHYSSVRDFSVIHRNIKSSKILLDDNYVPKLAGFELSMTTVTSRRDRLCIDDPCGTIGYVDPTYAKTRSVTHKSDVYSLGVVLIEVLFGMKAIIDKRDMMLVKEAKSRYENKKLDEWIKPDLRKQMHGESLEIFSKIAYDCLKEHRAGRPSIAQVLIKLEKALHLQRSQTERALIFEQLEANVSMLRNPADKRASERLLGSFLQASYEAMNLAAKRSSLIHELEQLDLKASKRGLATNDFLDRYSQESHEEKNNLQISLADIKLATQDFCNDNLIGKGGFGQVYRGKLLSARGHKIIAAKRLDGTSDQGETELMTELVILSEYKHMNVIDLVSYCNENEEKVIVYDYASKGSLDKWLKRKELTWRKRLEICVDIARGLDFLHGTSGVKQEVVIHRDIKSANILLHDDWKASIADFGLSLISPINRDINYVIDNAKGTPGYCDPLYITTKILTKESDIYSFGVLLFEMLCGRFVMEHNSSRAQNLVHLVRRHFEEGTLYEMVFEAAKKQMVPESFTAFQNIAYQCLHETREKRPTANDVLIQLKKALDFQEVMEIWKTKLPKEYERLIQMTDCPEIYYAMNKDLYTWLRKGIPHRDHKAANGGRVETISATEFQFKSYYRPDKWRTLSKSRFGKVVQISDSSSMNIRISVKTLLLSPGFNYGVFLVYKFCHPRSTTGLNYDELTSTHTLTIKMGSEYLFPEFTTRRDNDGWMRIELYRFSNLKEEAKFDAFLKGFSEDPFKNVAIYVEGVEFQPIRKMTHEEIEELKKVNMADVELSPTDEGQLEVKSAEVQELPTDECGVVLRILYWVIDVWAFIEDLLDM